MLEPMRKMRELDALDCDEARSDHPAERAQHPPARRGVEDGERVQHDGEHDDEPCERV